jgi:hypothetical protein
LGETADLANPVPFFKSAWRLLKGGNRLDETWLPRIDSPVIPGLRGKARNPDPHRAQILASSAVLGSGPACGVPE